MEKLAQTVANEKLTTSVALNDDGDFIQFETKESKMVAISVFGISGNSSEIKIYASILENPNNDDDWFQILDEGLENPFTENQIIENNTLSTGKIKIEKVGNNPTTVFIKLKK